MEDAAAPVAEATKEDEPAAAAAPAEDAPAEDGDNLFGDLKKKCVMLFYASRDLAISAASRHQADR